ncbi:Glycosyltransferase involved in cell wall bisynthesis [Solimonas aquatica]|uniref:Glycosyltransferase involved in cell wall bisynthesis n=1 Tax=Solimonas aquatica TaxID=489703 RepID=A0A1H9E5M5_9GAMM|nr:glycosyltransferase [Solimonas aquatica]SEQ20208.1 Glycosyltransferase involved in cell wall bisynthesis [Solimonas aquatica]
MSRKTVCLNMIVKNEAHVIRRCLESVLPLIDSWLIVDTGSSDGTQALIREYLKDLPGELVERPWVDFAHNRSEAIELARARADYLLFIDADDCFQLDAGFRMPVLDAQAYEIQIDYASISYRRVAMVSTALPWRWEGVIHEYLECGQPCTRALLPGVRMKIVGGGGRSLQGAEEKYRRDAEVLERALQREPDHPRYTFYLAQSYRDCGELEKSLSVYRRRAQLGGFAEEAFCALLEAARLCRRLGRSSREISEAYLQAYDYRPTRAESLGELAEYHRLNGPRWPLAQLYARAAIAIAQPDDVLFVSVEWYQWRALDEYAIASYWMGDYEACRQSCESLLGGGLLPAAHRERVQKNLGFALDKLAGRT